MGKIEKWFGEFLFVFGRFVMEYLFVCLGICIDVYESIEIKIEVKRIW